ncbi:MAG: AAA family ATPase [Rhodobacteraceae bacterium]|nr:AAA family ATPase [Paracoccaceae bacterium]
MLTLFANFKGGTGKSTLVFNMAIWCLSQGKAVTVCDLDPQRTVSDVADIRAEDAIEPSLKVVHALPDKGKERGEWLVDVGASDMVSLRAAVRAAGRIVIPVTPSQADIWATQHFLGIIAEETAGSARPEVLGFVNRADPHPMSRENAETFEAMQALDGIRPLEPKLVQRLTFRRSFSEGLAAFELEPRGKAADELDALAREIYT